MLHTEIKFAEFIGNRMLHTEIKFAEFIRNRMLHTEIKFAEFIRNRMLHTEIKFYNMSSDSCGPCYLDRSAECPYSHRDTAFSTVGVQE
jgi:hypothetical protein